MKGFARQQARTRRYTLGIPRGFTPGTGPEGPFLVFLRTDRGDDPVNHLWRWDADSGASRKLVDARALLADDDELSETERSLRERAREMAGGITSYATDAAVTVAAFTVGGRLFTVSLASGELVAHPTASPAFDPRLSPDGDRLVYHADDSLHLVEPTAEAAERERLLVAEPGVSWGRAEFVAAEEMGRTRGFWWSADGSRLAAARVDERHVATWTIADPGTPWNAPTAHRYPAAGTPNADVSLWVVDVASGERTEVVWDRQADEYLANVSWGSGPLTLLVQPRDQRRARVLTADPATGATRCVREWRDEAWVELVPGSPRWLGEQLVTVEDRDELGPEGTRAVCLDGEPCTPPGLQVRELVAVGSVPSSGSDPGWGTVGSVTFVASGEDPTRVDVHEVVVRRSGTAPVADAELRTITGEEPPGVHRVVVGSADNWSGTSAETPSVLVRRGLESPHPEVHVRWADEEGRRRTQQLEVVAEAPVLEARPRFLELGPRRLRAALFLPSEVGRSPLPVLLDPYGGPHAQRVLRVQAAHLSSQWLAEQGFAVLVTDGRGSPGRGPRFERAVRGDLATPVLEDQVAALQDAARIEPRLDLTRVGIRGWSFGGFLAALAVLRRPDVFRAGVAGAPVTDWHLYDTHYTERYLGDPRDEPEAYGISSLVDREGRLLGAQPWDERHPPALLLIHGLADDNVVAAHSLRLSNALLADGRPHRFLPLSGVTHMTPQEMVAEHLLTHQVGFLREALA